MKVGIVGGGVFGLAAALELAARGHSVTIVEQDDIPAVKAASNDESKTIQRLYGRRELYVDLAERAEVQWRQWQEQVVDWAPGLPHVLVAGGGSGHGFKFGGVLGPLIADALEDRDNPLGAPFRLAGRLG